MSENQKNTEEIREDSAISAENDIVKDDNNITIKEEKKKAESPVPKKSQERKPMSRKVKHSLISVTISLFVIIAIVLVNLIASTLTNKFSSLTADITSLKSFEITEQSRNIAENISQKVKISFLTDRASYIEIDPYCKQTAFIAEEMEKYSNGLIEVQYIDLVRNPSFAENYTSDNLSTTDIIVSCGENSRILTVSDLFNFESYSENYQYIASSNAEQELDNAIVGVTNEEITNVILITDNCSQDYSYFEKTLSSNGYKVTDISLNSADIPSDTDMVIIYAPAQDYTEEAVNKIESFLNNNGNYGKTLLYAAESQDADTPLLDKLLASYGMSLEHGFAFEADSNNINSSSTNYFDGVLCSYFSNLYTDYVKDNKPVITGYARPITILDADSALPLLSYSEYSGECPFDADESWNVSDAITGKTFVLAQGQNGTEEKHSTVILSGTYRIFTKSYYGSAYSNHDYFSALIASVNNRELNRISVAEKVISQFDINISQQAAVNLGFVVYALIPIIILGIGFAVFLMRRHR